MKRRAAIGLLCSCTLATAAASAEDNFKAIHPQKPPPPPRNPPPPPRPLPSHSNAENETDTETTPSVTLPTQPLPNSLPSMNPEQSSTRRKPPPPPPPRLPNLLHPRPEGASNTIITPRPDYQSRNHRTTTLNFPDNPSSPDVRHPSDGDVQRKASLPTTTPPPPPPKPPRRDGVPTNRAEPHNNEDDGTHNPQPNFQQTDATLGRNKKIQDSTSVVAPAQARDEGTAPTEASTSTSSAAPQVPHHVDRDGMPKHGQGDNHRLDFAPVVGKAYGYASYTSTPISGRPVQRATENQPPYFGQNTPRPHAGWPGAPTRDGRPPQKPDPRQLHQMAGIHRREASPPPTWKRLWRRIEGSLDGLADLETALGGKAKQLYSTTVDTATAAVGKVPARIQRRSPPSSAPPKFPNRRQLAGQDSRTQNKRTPPSLLERVSHKSLSPPATNDSVKRDHAQTIASTRDSEGPSQSRMIDWGDVMTRKTRKMIRANGGASTPSDALASKNTGERYAKTAALPGIPTRQPSEPDVPSVSLKKAFPARSQALPEMPKSIQREAVKIQNSFDEFDAEPASWRSRLRALIPSIPRVHFGRSSFRDYSSTYDAWKADDDSLDKRGNGFLGLFRPREEDVDTTPNEYFRRPGQNDDKSVKLSPTLASLGGKCSIESGFPLLTVSDLRRCQSIGRLRACFDIASVLFFLLGLRCIPPYGMLSNTSVPPGVYAENLISFLSAFAESWAPLALLAALLSTLSSQLVLQSIGKKLASSKRNELIEEANYGRLFLRLFTSESTPMSTILRIGAAAYKQCLAQLDLARLRNFLAFVFLSLFYVALAQIHPLIEEIGSILRRSFGSNYLEEWPFHWKFLWTSLRESTALIFPLVSSAIRDGLSKIYESPVHVAYEASLILALLSVSALPSIEAKRMYEPSSEEEDEDETLSESHYQLTDQVISLGSSSASRLAFLSQSLEGVLERWRLIKPSGIGQRRDSFQITIKLYMYCLLSTLILLCPVISILKIGTLPARNLGQIIRWTSLLDLCVVLCFVQTGVWAALHRVFAVKSEETSAVGFVHSINAALKERSKQLQAPSMSLQLQASVTPASGLAVRDLWVAHTTKRAWAIRGANIDCRSGEVLLILGDESAGKTILLTSLAESFLMPPASARSVTRINRGSVTLGGLDITKWDASSLRKRVGVLVRDARSSALCAQTLSGLTMEEILDPNDASQALDPSHTPTRGERACISQSMHITGLNSSLLARLPSKMATVVTANEDDLKPSPFRARSTLLSPVEWSKLLLARVLSHAIFLNDNAEHSPGTFANCLVGSVLLLDDCTSGFSEIDEARVLKNLRQTGAAVLVTSNRWASGRWADRIVVLQNGMIVESGTHSELLNLGAQKSIYASNWHAMTSIA